MRKRLPVTAAATLALLAVAVLPASASPTGTASPGSVKPNTSSLGTWWGAVYYCGTMAEQPRYTNSAGGGNAYTRVDGFGVQAGAGNGYVRKVTETEQMSGVQYGPGRTVTYTGSATSATMVDIPTTYLPSMVNTGYGAAVIQEWTSTGGYCISTIPIGQP